MLSVALLASALLSTAVGVSTANATSGGGFPCTSWSITTPIAGYGIVASTAKGVCITNNGFGEVYAIVKMWDLERDGHTHLISTTITDATCGLVAGATICTFNFVGHTAVAPPTGRYHAELEVIGGYASQAPGLVLLDDANSGVFCDAC